MRPSADPLASSGQIPAERLGVIARFGERIINTSSAILLFIGDLSLTLARGLIPGNWRRTMRAEFERAFYLVGVRAINAVAATALLVGLGLVLQIIYWLEVTGQAGSVGNLLVLVLIRELSPVITALIVIGRSGSVMLDEVGGLQVNGQIRMLESCGIDPIELIAIPQCFATALSLFALTMLFVFVALGSGYFGALFAGLTFISLLEFIDEVLSNMTLGDHLLLLIKPLIIGFVVAYIAIWVGLRVEPSVLGVRRALPRGFLFSLLATFLIGIVVSVVL